MNEKQNINNNLIIDNYTINDIKEYLTDIKYKSKTQLQVGGGCDYSNYTYEDVLHSDKDYVSIHNSINQKLRNLIYENSMKPLGQNGGSSNKYKSKTKTTTTNTTKSLIKYNMEMGKNNLLYGGGANGGGINLNFYDIMDNKNVGIDDIDFTSPRVSSYLKSQKGSGILRFLKTFAFTKAGKFRKFVSEFEKVRTNLESLIKTFEVESKTFERRANRNAELIYEYYVAHKYNSILHILKNNESEALENFRLKRNEDHEDRIILHNIRFFSFKKLKKDINIIDKYLKLNSFRIKEIENKLKSLKKIMMKDLKKRSIILFGLIKGSNFFDKLKKNLETDFNAMEKLMEERNKFTEDMEKAKEAVFQYVELSKSEESELLPERKKLIKLYEKKKEYFDNLSRYTPEKLQPLFDLLEKKSVLFARIEHYKKQYFSLKVETLKDEFNKWDNNLKNSYKLLKDINKESGNLAKKIGETLDNITFTINSVKVIQNQDVKEMIEDFKIVYENLQLCENLQKSITDTSAAILYKIGKMEPLKNIMKDMFNIKLAQSMVQNKMQYIYNEVNSKYQSAQLADYLKKKIMVITGGSYKINSIIDNLYNSNINGGGDILNYNNNNDIIINRGNIHNKVNKNNDVNFMKLINNKIGGAGGRTGRGTPPVRYVKSNIINYPTNFLFKDNEVLTNYIYITTGRGGRGRGRGGDKKAKRKFITQTDTSNIQIISNSTASIFYHVVEKQKPISVNTILNSNANINITNNSNTNILNLSNALDTKVTNNMQITTLPNGFTYINYTNPTIKNTLIKHANDLKGLPDKYFVYLYKDNSSGTAEYIIYIYKNFNTELKKYTKTDSLSVGFIEIEHNIYFYNPLYNNTSTPPSNNFRDIYNQMDKGLCGIKIQFNTLSGTTIKILYPLPLFYKCDINYVNQCIAYDKYFLINPFTNELIISYNKLSNIDSNKDDKNKFNFKTGIDSFIDMNFKICNNTNLDILENLQKKLLSSTQDFIITFTYNLDIFKYTYDEDILSNYIYFHPGCNGYIENYYDVKPYGIYDSSNASYLDSNIAGNTISHTLFNYNDFHKDNIDRTIRTSNISALVPPSPNIYLIGGLPPHHDLLSNISNYINEVKNNNDRKYRLYELNQNTIFQFCYINNHLFTTSTILNDTSKGIYNSNIFTEFKKHHHYNFDSIYENLKTKDLLINYNINKNYDLRLFKDIEGNTSITDNDIKNKYNNKDTLVDFFKSLNFLEIDYNYELEIYQNLHTDSSLKFIKKNQIIASTSNVLPVVTTSNVLATASSGTSGLTGLSLSSTITLTPPQQKRYDYIINQLSETGVIGKLDNIYNITEKFSITTTDPKYNDYNSIFNKCLNLLNDNLKRETELVSTPKKIKKHKDFLTGFTYVTDKLDIKVKDDKNKATTPEGENLENIIKDNRDLINNVGEALNLTPKSVYYDSTMNAFIHKIIEWTAVKGARPNRDYGHLYNIKFDNFFINKDNVIGFINEMENDPFYKKDRDIRIKIGKFFHYLPSFMSKNLSYYKDVNDEIRDYVKEYNDSIKPAAKPGRSGAPASGLVYTPTTRST